MKKKIVIASVLKPIDDVRAFWKLSQTMAKTNKYEVNIIGNNGKKPQRFDNIHFHPHNVQRRNLLKRYFLRILILWKILKINPSILIIQTHELLVIALVAKLLTKAKVIYDIQENYYLNITAIKPSPIRNTYGLMVRLKERILRNIVDEFWLAEKSYRNEIDFLKDNIEIIENKAWERPIRRSKSKVHKLLFSGTISEYSGIEEAVNLFEDLVALRPETTLRIIGQVHNTGLKIWLQKKSDQHKNLSLKVSSNPIPHEKILEAIDQSSVGIISYLSNEVNKNKVPTKLFEYSRYGLSYVVQKDTYWANVGASLGAQIIVDFKTLNAQELIEGIEKSSETPTKSYPEEATWEFESMKVNNSIERLINRK